MAGEEEDDNDLQHLILPLDPNLSMIVIRESTKDNDDLVIFPPINHENLQVSSSIYGIDTFLQSPSSSSSSSRRSASSSSFSLSPSDSDGQPPLSPSETPPSDLDEKCQDKSPRSTSEQGGGDSVGKPPWKPLRREAEILRYWCEFLLVRLNSKLKSLVTWFSTTLRSFYPLLAVAIWWWLRVRARRQLVNGESIDHLRDAIKERDNRILKLLTQIAQMNELLVKHHKDIVSRK